MSTTLFAENQDNRDAEHSVREIISNVTASEEKDVSIVDKFKKMFKKGKLNGNVRSIYSTFDNKNEVDTYATAFGGSLKYELAEYNGFNAGARLRSTNDISFATGKNDNHNPDLSSEKGVSNEVSEAYINYRYKDFNLRVGRQVIDTPLADSDDIRMAPDTFEAYVVSYQSNDVSFVAAHLNAWQGYDAGLDNGWVKTGKDGVNFCGLTYSTKIIDASLWYYNISNASASDIANGADENGNNSIYADISGHFDINQELFLHLNVQYLNQKELDKSGVQAEIYGTMAEIVFKDLSISGAYNHSAKQTAKRSFSGYGGGTLYTSMDTMILDEITEDRDAEALVGSISYTLFDINMLYAYGDFNGKANSLGKKEHIVAQNFGLAYETEGGLTLGTIYVLHDNKEDLDAAFYNGSNFRILASYNF
jgi:hypothetical protein